MSTQSFEWSPQPEATSIVRDTLDRLCQCQPFLVEFASRLLKQTGTRLFDWVDHLALKHVDEFVAAGFLEDEFGWLRSPSALLPAIRHSDKAGVALKVDSVSDFLLAQRIRARGGIRGDVSSPLRLATLDLSGCDVIAVERHGARGMEPVKMSDGFRLAMQTHLERLRLRQRAFANDAEGFSCAGSLIDDAIGDVGLDVTCALFFQGERDYWQSRNSAAAVQKTRQDRLGLGWANHDHHTYRSSRAAFAPLIAVLEQLGFHCRERFYAGRDAGWGAQVLEQPHAGITIFADVDLSPEEISGDFAHAPLPPRDELGTVGLWCALHGEAFLQAGMHHLECQFDFDAAREQLASDGVLSMKPFTDFSYLRQCFTEGEVWPVEPSRLEALVQEGKITNPMAAQFASDGVIGSHLEILERNDGYRGFNQTGISDIIQRTDPRLVQR